jgi:hypothetical protein
LDNDKILPCAISREALDDHFGGDNKDKLKFFNANRERIEHAARRKYLADRVERDGSVLIRDSGLVTRSQSQLHHTVANGSSIAQESHRHKSHV